MELPANAALVVIDVQDAFILTERGRRNNPRAEANIARLLAAWRAAGRPVYHVRDNSRSPASPFHPSHPGNAIQAFAQPLPGEPLIEKDAHSAFIRTDFEARLRAAGITSLVLVGLVTNHCVESTARMAGNLDFDTWVVSDATAAYDGVGLDGRVFDAELLHAVSLANLAAEFARVADTETVLAAVSAPVPV